MTVIDFRTRNTILVEDVSDEDGMKVEVDGIEVEDADEILVITNTVDGDVSIHTNMEMRDIIYMLELVKFDLLRKMSED